MPFGSCTEDAGRQAVVLMERLSEAEQGLQREIRLYALCQPPATPAQRTRYQQEVRPNTVAQQRVRYEPQQNAVMRQAAVRQRYHVL